MAYYNKATIGSHKHLYAMAIVKRCGIFTHYPPLLRLGSLRHLKWFTVVPDEPYYVTHFPGRCYYSLLVWHPLSDLSLIEILNYRIQSCCCKCTLIYRISQQIISPLRYPRLLPAPTRLVYHRVQSRKCNELLRGAESSYVSDPGNYYCACHICYARNALQGCFNVLEFRDKSMECCILLRFEESERSD